MATINIDGQSFEVDSSKNLLEVILSLGFDLPYFCWHPALGSVGSCRQCAVKKYRGEEDHQGQLVMACMEPALDGLLLSIKDQEAVDFREKVIEWLMLNHPHDCPICDEGGECHLQDMTVMAGHAYRRTRFRKRTYNNQDLGPCINHEMNRCIQCYRCVRFYDDYAGGDDLQVFSAHDHVYFGRHQDGTLESEFSGNLVEVCPTGVFTDKTLKEHYTRKWDLTSAPSVCHQCSLGCNILTGERYGSLRRVLSRFNPEVNGYFICDRGRFGYDFVNGTQRIRKSRTDTKADLTPSEATNTLNQLLTNGPVMGIGSPRASLESNYMLRELVGADNFFNGISGSENQIVQMALTFMKEGPVRTPSLKEIETYDAVIVIGEDLTNTAPMLDLALNQSVRVRPLEQLEKVGIPDWNDAAVRDHLQQEKGPLFILTPQTTKLDRIGTRSFRGAPGELTDLVLAVARHFDPSITGGSMSSYNQEFVAEVAKSLGQAKKPLIITGSSLNQSELVKAAINLAGALFQSNPLTGFSFVASECNTVGAGMLEEKDFSNALTAVSKYQKVLILENDLYRRAPADRVSEFLGSVKQVIGMDHTESDTTAKTTLLLASGTFAEADGTLVNNEGRAQRFFQVQASDVDVHESWRWLQLAAQALGHEKLSGLNDFDAIIRSIEADLPQFAGVVKSALPADHRIHGQRISRAPHRYSGRTAMFADHSVNEPRPPKDQDSPMSFTMEGYRGIPPESTTSYYWSPGWNSAQAITKFRNEIAFGRNEQQAGVRLLDSPKTEFKYLNGTIDSESKTWTVIPIHHIFGSEEFSIKSAALQERGPEAFVVVNQAQAAPLGIKHEDNVTLSIDGASVTLKAQVAPDWPQDHVGISVGFPGVPYVDHRSEVQLKPKGHED